MIDSTRLASFIAFAEELNFTRAAARLHVSQPALHVQIRRLSEDLKAPLYHRVGRGLELSPQGRQLLGFGRQLREQTESFLAGLGGDALQRVVLAAGEGALLYRLGPAIRKAARSPGVKMQILTRDRDGTLAALATSEAQLGVTTLEVVPEAMEATLLRRSGMVLVVPHGHRLAKKRRVRLADLAGERLVVPPATRPHRQLVARALASAGVEWEVALEASGWEVMLHHAALGLGLAIVNDVCRIPHGTVARQLPEIPSLNYYVLHERRRKLSGPAQALRRLIVDTFSHAVRATH
jgi:LysR family transcriptional regulator, low CO2-responsive transcriptional regulator